MYGLKKKHITAINSVFGKNPEIKQVILYGSRAKGNYRNGSDIDLTLKGEDITLSLLFKIETELDDLLLPYKIDLSIYHKIENPDFIEHINRVGIVFYEKEESEEWIESRLSDVAKLIKESWKVGEKELPYVALEHIVEGGLRLQGIGDSNTIASNKYRFDSSSFLFGKLRPYFRKLFRPDFEGICSTDIWVVKPQGDNDKDFLFYFFANQEFIDFTYSGSSGTRMPRADWNFVGESKWLFPKPKEQKSIAKILTNLDDKIDLLHRQNETLEAMAETLFRKWFVEESDEEWEVKPLSGIANFLNGLACQKFLPRNEIDKLPVLKIKQLRNGFSGDYDWCTKDVKPEYIIKNGDVIFSWSASLMVKIWDGETAILNQHLFKVTSDEFPKWFYYLWSKHHLEEFISISASHATTMGHIKRGDLDNAMVLVPDDDKMIEFTEIQEPIIEKIISNNKQLSKLVELRETLLPQLMSGEVRVNFEKLEEKIL